jgi:hypothetical protein
MTGAASFTEFHVGVIHVANLSNGGSAFLSNQTNFT